jgi:DNA-binding MarR family transcriptional regulator
MTVQSMSTIIRSLTDSELIDQLKDVVDRRRTHLSISKRGRAVLDGVRREKSRRLARAISDVLTPTEVEQLTVAIPLLERVGRVV